MPQRELIVSQPGLLGNQTQTLRRLRASERLRAALQPILDHADSKDVEAFALRVKSIASPPDVVDWQHGILHALTDGRNYSPEESAMLELENQVRRFKARRDLLTDAILLAQAAELLGTSPRSLRDRVANGSLLALSDNGRLLFPLWQFDADGPNGVLAGLPRILTTLKAAPFAKARWLTRPNPALDGHTPIDLLKRGDAQRVVEAARSVGVA